MTALIIILAPLFFGIVKWVKCYLQNRTSPPIWQPYLNLNKLFHKQVLIADTTSQIFRATPYIIFGIMIFICAFLPYIDVILLIGLLSLSRFFLILAGMDTGTAFGGMGSSRENLISSVAEPALLIALFAAAIIAGSTNLAVIVSKLSQVHFWIQPSLIFAAAAFALVALAETGRIPIDNPATHLELTMIHEAMLLEYSGRYLALMEWAAQIKFMLYAVLLINIFFAFGNNFNITFLGLKLIILIIILGASESCLAKLRLFRVPYLLNIAFLFGLLSILTHFIIEVK
jgi:formate hydrogenlyase subunit 4